MASSSSSPEISSAEPTSSFSYKDATKEDVLEDLSSRFILNLPDHELASLERVCFQVEQAHWFYEDFVREQNNKLPSLPLKKFSEMLFQACPLLHQFSHSHDQTFNDFMQYKTRVPVCGAIMLNDIMDKCVLVKGWKASSGWGFPKGKINETEPPPTCAIREVLEETGYNLAGQLDPKDVIELSIKEQKISLYIVSGIPEDFPFKTKTRKEISKIEWFKLSDLPTWKRNKNPPGRFYLISPFISGLKAYINQRKPRNQRKLVKQKKIQPAAAQPSNTTHHPTDFHKHKLPTSQPVNGIILSLASSSLQADSPNDHPDISDMDPHITRLLSSLTMSAVSLIDRTSQDSSSRADTETVRGRPSPSPPSDTSGDSPVITCAAEQPDWSSSVPPNYSQSSAVSPKPPTSQPRLELYNSSPTSTAAVRPVVDGPSRHADQGISNTMRSRTPSSSPPVVIASPTSVVPSRKAPTTSYTDSPSFIFPTSPTSRRSSSTVDISPYLARTTVVPTSAKRLQQLSLLESVANESEKLAPIIAARAAMVSRGTVVDPHSPSSIHQPIIQNNPRDDGILYSSIHPAPPSSAASFHPRQPMGNFRTEYHDPLQVRSRTSQAFHRPSMHNPTGSVNINHNQLLATINNAHGGPISPGYQMSAQLIHEEIPSTLSNGSGQFCLPGMPQFVPRVDGFNSFPDNLLQNPLSPLTGFRPTIQSGPIANATLNMVPLSQNPSLSLLSILNGRPAPSFATTQIRR
ncbi:DCP2-domain-containing protein [Pholiota conissans]|uniref:DCP2-domain-containing protein n=1 Tax=Pholiota conissans TaxID=109636 RepID=A0A9P6CSS4_9AGAR|nr:DCP2-domain-containing protein [Pholiota conissans]